MSADNGVYILRTPKPGVGFEYRVSELGAIDNLWWNDDTFKETHDPLVIIKNARRMWHGCIPFFNETPALEEAAYILRRLTICEYGICFINVGVEF